MGKITVIVPVYKVEPYLDRCVNSLLCQTFQNYEIILVDDGSPDSCGKMCDEYSRRDPRIYVIHQRNAGLSAARNAGLDRALSDSECEWVSFVDSDDWVHPMYLEALFNAAVKYDAELAIGGYLRTNGELIVPEIDLTACTWRSEEYYLHDMVNATVSWGKLYKKTVFHTLRFPVGKIHEDEFISYKILFNYEYVTVVEQPLYFYYQNPKGISKGKWSVGRLDGLDALEKQIVFFYNKGLREIARRKFNSVIRINLKSQECISNCDDLDPTQKKQLVRKTKKQLRRLLIRYRKCRWLPFWCNDYSKRVYENAFTGVRISRKIWGGVKPILILCYPVRAIGRRVKKIWGRKSDFSALVKYLREATSKKVILLQTPLHGNLGDHAIALAEVSLLNELGVSYAETPHTEGIENWCARVTQRGKIIAINGGGYLGDLWKNEEKRFRDTLNAFPHHRIIVFPQTVHFDLNSEEGKQYFEESKAIYEAHSDLTLFVREMYSYRFMQENMPNVHVELAPDMAMTLEYPLKNGTRAGAVFCLRSDKEKTLSEAEYALMEGTIKQRYKSIMVTDTVLPGALLPGGREEAILRKLSEFEAAELVVTDRLHGMIFAAVTQTPCIVLHSLSHKIEGCYEWLRDLEYIRLAEQVEDVPALLDEIANVAPVYGREKYRNAMQQLREELLKTGD